MSTHFQDIKNTIMSGISMLAGLLSFFVQAGTAVAASIGSIAKSAESDLMSTGPLIALVGYLAGLALCVVGLLKFYQLSNQPGSSKGPAIAAVLIGALLLGISAVIQATSGTFGDGGASTGLGKLGIGG